MNLKLERNVPSLQRLLKLKVRLIGAIIIGVGVLIGSGVIKDNFVSNANAQIVPGLTNKKIGKMSFHSLMGLQSQLAAIANNVRHTKATRRAAKFDFNRVTKELAKRRRIMKKKSKG